MSRGREAFRSAMLLCATLVPIVWLAPAQASENASECCAALDARIAELRPVLDNNVHDVKVKLYGQVNRANFSGRGIEFQRFLCRQ